MFNDDQSRTAQMTADDPSIGPGGGPAGEGDRPGRAPHEELKLSDHLATMAADTSRERVSVAHILTVVRDRAFGALIFIFAMPNVVPTPPGTSSILGLPLILLTAQLMLGRPVPWLPRVVAQRSMRQADFAAIMYHVIPWIVRAERLLRPRLCFLVNRPLEQVIGGICLLLAVILTLPIPLGNIPPAIALSLFALSLLERDGVAMLLGLVATIVSLVIVSGVIVAIVASALFLLGKALAL